MTLVLLIRHGENDYVKKNRLAGHLSGIHLNEKGRSQAQTLADRLARAPVKAVYSSPLERTMETAQPIAKALGLEVISRPGLIETNIGKWQGKRLKLLSLGKQWKVLQSTPSLLRFPGGESVAETQYRISNEIDSLRRQHGPRDLIICVSHADPIKLVVAYFLGLPLDFFQRLSIAPASITAMYISDSASRLLTLNYNIGQSLLGDFPQFRR